MFQFKFILIRTAHSINKQLIVAVAMLVVAVTFRRFDNKIHVQEKERETEREGRKRDRERESVLWLSPVVASPPSDEEVNNSFLLLHFEIKI